MGSYRERPVDEPGLEDWLEELEELDCAGAE
jgi:hypothetical protein